MEHLIRKASGVLGWIRNSIASRLEQDHLTLCAAL